jgi:hypothetical protein
MIEPMARLTRRCSAPRLARVVLAGGAQAGVRRLALFGMALVGCRPTAGTEPPASGVVAMEPVPGDVPTESTSSSEPVTIDDAKPRGEPPPAFIDKGLIRTVVRSHVDEIRGCYDRGLAADPKLAGRVAMRFTIDPGGAVSEAVVASSDLPPAAASVQACIVAAVKGWRFPVPPGSGNAEVLYPFVLEPGRAVASPSGLVAGEQIDGRWFQVAGLPPRTAVVEVLDGQRRPVAGAKVTLALAMGAGSDEREATTDAQGRATFEGLPSGATAIAMVAEARTESTAVGGEAVGVIVLIEGDSSPPGG